MTKRKHKKPVVFVLGKDMQKRTGPIFSGPNSASMWNEINSAKSKKDLRLALYVVCCRIQDLESKIDELAIDKDAP